MTIVSLSRTTPTTSSINPRGNRGLNQQGANLMATLMFTLDGESADLEWIRTRVDVAIQEVIDEAVDEGRIEEGAVNLNSERGD
jgi:hypothetical protein